MRLILHGVVQGVGFRPAVHRIAAAMGIDGSVYNRGSDVVIDIRGDGDRFLEILMSSLPPLASVESVEIVDMDYDGAPGFHILPSSSGHKGAGIPVDTAICPSCLKEMTDPRDRRYGYPFTSCTDCGARFTLIDDLPYDRENTAMRSFPLCPDCQKEYSTPGDRRFHHQTICCPKCGPKYRFIKEGKEYFDRPIERFAELLEKGGIGVAKSWGGMHICSILDNVPHLRKWYGRKEKPFAIMVKDLAAAERYAAPDDYEKRLLLSPQRPIVLLKKKGLTITELVSPGLDNIGIFLPYTGMQHLLFRNLDVDALVMTSANVPGEPMIIDDSNVMSLGADAYILHNQEIICRADDSVIRTFDGGSFFIRRSRGHTPAWLPAPGKRSVIGLGAQENITGAVAHGGRIYCTQYIGDADHIGVLEYLDSSISHLRKLLGTEHVDAMAMDLHPAYSNRRLAKRIAVEEDIEPIEVQHHWAHAASLLVDSREEAAVFLTLDGSGYGDDGSAWGGEVICASFDSYSRSGHLRPFPLLGGEKAVYDVRRLCYAIDRMTGRRNEMFSDTEQDLFDKIMDKSVLTSSMGRVMDAVSCYLGVCNRRSYDGEPAMKLEPLLNRGKKVEGFEVRVQNGVIDSLDLIANVISSPMSPEDKAYSIVAYLIETMVDLAADTAEREGLNSIGVTGGVSYNSTVCDIARKRVESHGLRLLRHREVPNGDGGISVGQVAIALRRVS